MHRRDLLTIARPGNRTPGRRSAPDGAAPRLADGIRQTPPSFLKRTSAGLEPFVPSSRDPWDYAKAAHLLRRTMVGPSETDIQTAVSEGLEKTVDRLMNSFAPTLDEIQEWAGQDPQTRPATSDDAAAFQTQIAKKKDELGRWSLRVIATSPVSIQERMTLLWHNHFTSELQVVRIAEFMYGQDQLLRSRALGNVKQLAKDVTKDMAMLIYLDGIKNFKSGQKDNINENYGRELQELFTMGVVDWNGAANYTQSDVHEAARALSGYTGTTSAKGTNYAGLASQFVPSRWDSGTKTFLGRTGAWKADDVIDIIFSERADQTAKFICEKIYRAFVFDIPDRTIVEEMATTLRSNDWEIKPVMLQLLKSAHFFDPTNIGAMEKSPIDFLIGMIRQLGLAAVPDFTLQTGARFGRDLTGRLTTLGQTVLDPPNVKGWPGGRTWISTATVPTRVKFGLDVMDQKIKGAGSTLFYTFDAIAFARRFPSPNRIQDLSADMARHLLPTPPSTAEAKMLLDTIMDGGASYDWNLDDPSYKADARIRKYLKALFQLAKFQLY